MPVQVVMDKRLRTDALAIRCLCKTFRDGPACVSIQRAAVVCHGAPPPASETSRPICVFPTTDVS